LRPEDVARSANTNPVAVRRLFSLMTTRRYPVLGDELAALQRSKDTAQSDVARQPRQFETASDRAERGLIRLHPVQSAAYPPDSAGGDNASAILARSKELQRAEMSLCKE
jgi:hypothetical protein